MRKLVEYKIISGQVVETRRSWLQVRQPGEARKGRAPRKAGNTSEKKIKQNEASSTKELARVINSTFRAGDAHVVLKYDNDSIPADYEAAALRLKKFLERVRREFRHRFNRLPVLCWVTANWSPRREAPARLHHHLVVEKEAAAVIHELWDGGGYSEEDLDGRGDHTDLAAYMIANVAGLPAGKKKWHATRNVSRPIYTEPVAVYDVEGIQPDKGATIKAHESYADEDGRITSAYLRCVLPVRPYVRGGKIVMPAQKKRKDKGG